MRALRPQNRLLILLAHASLWQTFTTEELREWTRTLAAAAAAGVYAVDPQPRRRHQ